MRAVQISEFGGPEVLQVADLPDPEPSGDQQVLGVRAAGVNYADTHQSENTYLAPQTLPFVPGSEVVVDGPDGRLLALTGSGGYAERIALDPSRAISVPDEVSDEQALTTLVQGTTAWYLLRHTVAVAPGETVVVHAAAGGVGTVAVQLAKLWGAGRVIATASSEDKRRLALDLGADEVVDSRSAELADELRRANGGERVDVVLEMTGGSVFDASLAALAPLGRIAVYGQASRQSPEPIDPGRLMVQGITVAGFWLAHLNRRPGVITEAVSDLFELIAAHRLRTVIGGVFGLAQAAEAHQALLSRGSTGKLILRPDRG